MCGRYKKHCVLQGLLRISKYDPGKTEKCKNAVFFKGGVGNARRADRLNRHFVGRGPPDDINCLTYPQHRPKIANISPTYAQHSLQDGSTWGQHRPNIGQHRPNIGQHRLNIGSTWAQDVPNIDHMGPTWPNLGPRCAPDSLTLLNIGPPSPTRTSFPPWHHPGPSTPPIA